MSVVLTSDSYQEEYGFRYESDRFLGFLLSIRRLSVSLNIPDLHVDCGAKYLQLIVLLRTFGYLMSTSFRCYSEIVSLTHQFQLKRR